MMVQFDRAEIPVVNSLIEAAETITEDGYKTSKHFAKYFYYWAAFNYIYSTISHTEPYRDKELKKDAEGNVKKCPNGSVNIPSRKNWITERDQIQLARKEFDDSLEHSLITHPSTIFFKDRTPIWNETEISEDGEGQKLNGVINIDYTISPEFPIWSPIDIDAFEKYINNPDDFDSRKLLIDQIVDLLYTVRCNQFHADKDIDDSNDKEVLENALALLKIIVTAFIR